MRPHTQRIAFLVIAVCLCLIGGVAAQQEGANTTASPAATTSAGGANVSDLTNAGAPQATKFVNNTSVTTFENVSGFTPDVSLELVAGNFTTSPMMATAAPGDDTGRLYVVDQIGVVKIVEANGTVVQEPFLDIRDKMANISATYDERGLLSIAFHPNFSENGKVYAFYSAPLRPEAPEGWSCTNHISEFQVDTANPNTVNTSSEKVLMYIDKSYENHNGGELDFSPVDGYLYISVGDIGKANDVGNGHTPGIGNAQDLTKIYGKILRIDVDNVTGGNVTIPQNMTGVGNQTGNMTGMMNQTGNATVNRTANPPEPTWTTFAGSLYGIPPDNPFAKTQPEILDSYAYDSVPPEIYAYGFRNPAYMSFDAGGNHGLFISMAGQDLFESVLDVVNGGNYGWNIREGTHCFNASNSLQPPASCNVTGYQGEPLIGPIVEYGHDVGNVIVGGQVYRGTELPNFTGKFVFGSWSSPNNYVTPNGTLFVATPPSSGNESMLPASAENLTPQDNAMWSLQKLNVVGPPNNGTSLGLFVRSISQDNGNELYLLTNTVGGPDNTTSTGSLWKFVPPQNATAGNATTTTTGNQTGYTTGNQTGYTTGNQTGYTTGNQTGYTTGNQTGYTTGNQTGAGAAGGGMGAGATPSSSSPAAPDHGQVSQIWGLLQPPASDLTVWELLQVTEGAIPFEETPVYGNFTTFIDLLQTTGVDRLLQSNESYTVFAPTDVAFADLPPGEQSALLGTAGSQTGTVNRTAIALNHIVPGSYTANALRNETTLATLAGNNLTVNATGDETRVDNATIIIPDLAAKNGVIQGIDRVLLPTDTGEALNPS